MTRSRRSVVLGSALLAAIAWPLARRYQLTWGTTEMEANATLPGDELVPRADVVATRAMSIQAAPQDVMPWLRQLGHDRAGFYTYTWLENLAGLGMENADRLVPLWQRSGPGGQVKLAEQVGLEVVELTDTAMVLHGAEADLDERAMPFDFSWTYALHADGSGTRLVIRERYACHGRGARLMVELVSPLAWVLTVGMMRGVRRRAERSVH